MNKQFVSSVRIDQIKQRTQLHAMGKHAMRLDDASKRRQRPDANLGEGLAFSSLVHAGSDGREFRPMRDVAAAYDFHRQYHDIAETRQGGLGFHALISINADWVAETGGIHDTANTRNRKLLLEAVAWIESWCGRNSVYAGRIDMDETGGGNVDAFVMPARIDGRTGRSTISASKALTELRLKHGERMSYVAAQTDWARWCQARIDSRIHRGKPKIETLIEHLGVEEYKAAHAEAKRRADAAGDRAQIALTKVRQIIDTAKRVGLDIEAQQRLTALEGQAEDLADFIRERHSDSQGDPSPS